MGCKLPTVNKFLCCLSLETGGFVMGWISAILSVISILGVGAFAIITVVAYNSDSINLNVDNGDEYLLAAIIILCVFYVIFVLYFIVMLYAAIQLIRGTTNRNHSQMKLYMIIMAIGVVMSFLQIFTIGVNAIASAIIGSIISAYFFICIYSLYEKVKAEKLNPAPYGGYPTAYGTNANPTVYHGRA